MSRKFVGVGAVVRLKSGGPKMTCGPQVGVCQTVYECWWFEGNVLKTQNFLGSMLEGLE